MTLWLWLWKMSPNIGRCSHPTVARNSGTWPLVIGCLDLPSGFNVYYVYLFLVPSLCILNQWLQVWQWTNQSCNVHRSHTSRHIVRTKVQSQTGHSGEELIRVSIYGWHKQSSLALVDKMLVETTKLVIFVKYHFLPNMVASILFARWLCWDTFSISMNMYDSFFSTREYCVGWLVFGHRIIKSLLFGSELAVAVSNVVIS